MQTTLKNPVEFRGIGLHSGKEARVTLKATEAGTGITFVRVDLENQPEVRAQGANYKARNRQTCLQNGRAEVSTVEHLLATLWALGVDNAIVEMEGEEVPGLDGSAREFATRILEAGTVELKTPRSTYAVKRPIYVREGHSTLVALPGEGGLTVEYHLDYAAENGAPAPTRQTVGFSLSKESFVAEIASARTFVFEHEVDALLEAGFGKGATRENTLVVGANGVQGNTLRCEDELARHKVLDLLGDLAVAGVDLDAHIIATRSGHVLNRKLVLQLLEEMHDEETRGEVSRETGLDIREILNLLPHRYPFLMIDRVVELDGFKRAVAIKNVSINEPYFQGHWPGQPIMPGVLQLEAMAQLSGVLLLRKLENTGKLAVLWSIDKVKLRGAVRPGDQLRIEVDTIRAKPSVGHVQARCKVAGRLVAEAQLKFTLVDA
jgi:UDP-3-O-[3-hydroxymyristoyl] N-acetylglucosamine deacetylase/3-hydroxyacyl-[acyl-carrier-protein] dehydratase